MANAVIRAVSSVKGLKREQRRLCLGTLGQCLAPYQVLVLLVVLIFHAQNDEGNSLLRGRRAEWWKNRVWVWQELLELHVLPVWFFKCCPWIKSKCTGRPHHRPQWNLQAYGIWTHKYLGGQWGLFSGEPWPHLPRGGSALEQDVGNGLSLGRVCECLEPGGRASFQSWCILERRHEALALVSDFPLHGRDRREILGKKGTQGMALMFLFFPSLSQGWPSHTYSFQTLTCCTYFSGPLTQWPSDTALALKSMMNLSSTELSMWMAAETLQIWSNSAFSPFNVTHFDGL